MFFNQLAYSRETARTRANSLGPSFYETVTCYQGELQHRWDLSQWRPTGIGVQLLFLGMAEMLGFVSSHDYR
jgi:hypothetical protein